MKLIIAAVLALAVLLPLAAIAYAHDEDDNPHVRAIVFAGKGFGLPENNDLNNLKWIDKVAVGAINKGNQTRRVGVMKVTDSEGQHHYKIRNIVHDEGKVTADIFDRNTSVGRLDVEFKAISGKEAWAGTLILGSWSGKVVIQGHRLKIDNEHRDRLIKEERSIEDCEEMECEFRGHFRHMREDARSREFIKEKCEIEENKVRCRVLFESRTNAGDVAHALDVVPIETLRKLEIRIESLIKETDIEGEVAARLEDHLMSRVMKIREALSSGSGSSGSGESGSSGSG